MKPYLLNIYTDTPHSGRFFESIKKIKVDHIEVKPARYPGNLSRYKFIPAVLDKRRFVIFTDTEDVIFQKDFPDFNKVGADIVVGPESEIHRNSYWYSYIKRVAVFKPLLDKPIYNAGCYAMRVSKFNQWLSFLGKYSELFTEDFDQLLLNLWLTKQKFVERLDLFAPLYDNLNKGLVKKKEDGWYTKKGQLISCVHGNGSMKKFL